MQITIDVQDEHEAEAVRRSILERRRQDRLFGTQNHDPAWWMVITGEEFGEMCKAVCDYRWAKDIQGDSTRQERIAHAVKEAEQVAACAIAFIQCVFRDEWRDEISTVIPSDKRQVAVALGVGDEQIKYERDGFQDILTKQTDVDLLAGLTEREITEMPSDQMQAIMRLGAEQLEKRHPGLFADLQEEKRISRSDDDGDR